MKQPEISNLNGVTQRMIDRLEMWLKGVANKKIIPGRVCPYVRTSLAGKECEKLCYTLFDNDFNSMTYNCPCHNFGTKATILAFTIICDVWKVYHKEAT